MVEFNPKGNNILDQELAVSGLEMNIWPIGMAAPAAAAAGGGLSLGGLASGLGFLSSALGVFGGINQSSAAQSAANRQFQIAAADRKHQIKVAKATNKYNDELDELDLFNYNQERDFAYKSLVKDWKRGKKINRFEHKSRMQEFRKNNRISRKQTRLNKKAKQQAISAEQAALRDTFIEQGFARQDNLSSLQESLFDGIISTQETNLKIQGIKDKQAYGQFAIQENINQLMKQGSIQKETAMVESLIAEGQAELGQAGKSTQKGKQSTVAALHRSLRSLDAELSGRHKQAAIQLAELNSDSSLALSGAKLDLKRINQSISVAQRNFEFNEEVIDANLASAIEASERNIEQISLDFRFANLNVKAGKMKKPKRLKYIPKPKIPPARKFLERQEIIVPKPLKKDRKNKLERALERGDVVRVEKPEDGEAGSDQVSDYNAITTDPAFNVDDRFD
jgi:hypothetical protein|tara:strand:+ start:66 stop:1418 length:1353 start_codon:yes stop_codon:yes gene_type:complete